MPSSALTRFIKQGLARGMCPLCRVAHKLEREYMWYFFDDYSGDADALDALRRSQGFCRDHAEQFRHLEVDGIKSTLTVSTVYLDTLEGLAGQLDQLKLEKPVNRDACPACEYIDDGVRKNARYLLEEIRESERSRELFLSSPGLCFPHFGLVWEGASAGERSMLLEVERRTVATLVEQLREHIRKQGQEAKHEPKGEEQDSWRRAIWLTGGWPPDAEEDLVDAVTGGKQ
jgi:hypothetical protein